MAASLEVESTLTDSYQTTVPETVRRALRLGKRDKIHYTDLAASSCCRAPSPLRSPIRCLGLSSASWPATSPAIQSAYRPLMPASCIASSR